MGCTLSVWTQRAFDYNGNAPREETPISGNDPKVWGKSFLKRAEGQTKYDWLTTGALGDKWTDIVALATDAPATYRGENGGDPCPKGMHIPSYTEWVSVMPSSFAVADFSGKIGFKHTTESITIQGPFAGAGQTMGFSLRLSGSDRDMQPFRSSWLRQTSGQQPKSIS